LEFSTIPNLYILFSSRMKELVIKAVIFLGINFSLALVAVNVPQYLYSWNNANTDSNLKIIPENQKFDLLIMGTSRARGLSRGKSHAFLERVLRKRVINIARGGGGGIVPESLYFEWFVTRGNSADVIIYAIDPFVFFSDLWNRKRFFATDEPLDFGFLCLMVKKHISTTVVWNYILSKFTVDWLLDRPQNFEKKQKKLNRNDPEAVHKRIQSLYLEGVKEVTFRRYSKAFETLVQQMSRHANRVVLLFIPTLLGHEPGQDKVAELCRKLTEKYRNVEFYDMASAMQFPLFFYNHDHMNNQGVSQFVLKYLKPILSQNERA